MWTLNGVEIVSAFLVLFAIIDVTGSVPIFLNLKSQNKTIHAEKAAFYSLIVLIGFLFIGEWILKLFQLDISAFAVAGAVVLLILSTEMIFGVEIFKNDQSNPDNSSTLFPVVFPLIAGPGSFTTLLSMRAEYHTMNIIVAVVLNLLIVYLVLRYLDRVKCLLGESGAYILRKFFGVILMAISVKLLTSNLSTLIATVNGTGA
ncbi:MAG: MarC family protein [Proteiniphilum sp.]|jgi:multiple antibiotic resistance protein|nr:MarC family protein [Proteiniphilum sp.]NCB25888.1 MarC family protein [Bacteroidia bacterium]MDD2938634.1 MarC family protein [Proteiniphilum sp.]MDD3076634.1 MarC family protein [Proteiniphilum sp.]MDD3778963.1 MarC family protein [Proteiniphilum sp.]